MNVAHENYTTIEKEMLVVVYFCDKLRSYIIWSEMIIYMDHATLLHFMMKQDAKPRLIRWVLLLQKFYMDIRDKKGSENVVAGHLSYLENEKGR